MKDLFIDHNSLTEDQLEEWVEFIDWSLVPSSLLTENIKKKFHSFPGLQLRIWFEDLFGSLEIKIDREEYPNRVFFFKGEEIYMELDEKDGNLSCSYKNIWSFFYDKIGRNHNETQRYIKNVVEMHFKNREVTPLKRLHWDSWEVKMHFKNMEVTPLYPLGGLMFLVEKHFKNVEVKPKNT